MADGDCPDCGHIWRLHPGVAVGVRVCPECIYEEDIGQRSVEDMCRAAPADHAEQVAARLLALLTEEAGPLVREGRASVRVTTSGEHFGHRGDETVYVLQPTSEGALPVCLLPQGAGWYVLPGKGPSLEYWEGTEADFQETRAVVGSVMAGHYHYEYEQRLVRPLLFRWRPARSVWVCKGFVGADDGPCGEHWNAPPEPGEPLAVQALPY